MKAELTVKQEKFCQVYIERGNASEAYRQAYDAGQMQSATINRKAKELTDNGKIAARIDELKTNHFERHKMTIDDVLAELEMARKAALNAENPQCSAAISATMHKAKLLGLDKPSEKVEQPKEITIRIVRATRPDAIPHEVYN